MHILFSHIPLQRTQSKMTASTLKNTGVYNFGDSEDMKKAVGRVVSISNARDKATSFHLQVNHACKDGQYTLSDVNLWTTRATTLPQDLLKMVSLLYTFGILYPIFNTPVHACFSMCIKAIKNSCKYPDNIA